MNAAPAPTEPWQRDSGRYDPGTVERKWQARWDEAGAFIRRDRGLPKWYVIELPPFATGSLHLGHARNYALADAGVRFRRMAGHDVLYTTGYDTFGLPSELAAREAGVHPSELAETCCRDMERQLRRLGLSHDTDRITAYHVPEYYRWVQWVFLRLLAQGHCERREGPVLWCPACDASLAESLAEDGLCWRCGTAAETRSMPQWCVKESHFADAMLAGLDELARWPETVRKIHADWIGRKTGRTVAFDVVGGPHKTIDVFVEDGVLLAGAVAIALTAEHPLLADGARLMLRHPAFQAPLPAVGVQDRLLPSAGAAIPLVPGLNPAHDRLIFELGMRPRPAGAVEPEGAPATIYRLRDWSIARQRYWGPPVPVVHCRACGIVPVPDAELPVLLPHLALDGAANPLAADAAFRETACPRCGAPAERDTDTFEAYSSPWWYHWMCMEAGDPSPFDVARAARFLPVDLMIGGSDQIRSCFFHVRMIAKALAAVGVVLVDEPVDCLLAIGMIQRDGRKMSKSAGNAVPLDRLLDGHGADAVRFAVLASAAPDRDVNWSDGLVTHAADFLGRVARFGRSGALRGAAGEAAARDAQRRLREKLRGWVETATHKVTANFVRHQYHLVPRNLEMLFDRLAHFQRTAALEYSREDAEALGTAWDVFLRLLCPVAPHLAEELWEMRGHGGFVSHAPWPGPLDAGEEGRHRSSGRGPRGHGRSAAPAERIELSA